MSAAWPWVILGRVPRFVPRDAAVEEGAELPADLSMPVALPPRVTVLAVDRIAHPDPTAPDKYPYIVAAGPSCLLVNFAVEPFYGVNSAVEPHQSYLMVVRVFHTNGVEQGRAPTADADSVPMRVGGMPVIYNIDSIGLASFHDGNHIIAELRVVKGSERAKLFRFHTGGHRWIERDLIYPLSAQDREWAPAGVVAQGGKLWWFDLSWGLLSCDPTAADPVLLFHGLPRGRALDATRPDIHDHRCVAVSRQKLRYVEIIPDHRADDRQGSEAATVSMWTWIPGTAGARAIAGWGKSYEMSFAEIWKDDSYKETGLPEKVPVLAVVCPRDPDVVYFDLEQHLFGVDVPAHKVVKFVREAYELVNLPWPTQASSQYVCAWNLPPSVAEALNLVSTNPSEQASPPSVNSRPQKMQRRDDAPDADLADDEEMFKLGLEVALTMSPAELKSAVDKYLAEKDQASSESQEEQQKPFDFRLTKEQAMADVMAVLNHGKSDSDN
ncbi:hypothetical protein ACP70R_047272 [Stipagrostis hirtigluma subsp. patula]